MTSLTDRNNLLKRPWLLASIVISAICIIFMMFVFRYSDVRAYQAWTLEFLDCVFGKTDVEFYEYTGMDLREACMPMPCDHSILTMLPVIIWNIPLWIYHAITGIMSAGGLIDMIWLKLGLVLCTFFIARETSKIIDKINPSIDSVIAYPLIFLSGDFMISTMYCGQDEVAYILCLVMALRYLIYDKKLGFLICSTIAVTLNPLTLLPILLMIVYREKRVLFILLDTVLTVIPTGIFEMIYKNNAIYQNAVVMNGGAMKSLFTSGVTLSQDSGKVPVIIILFCLLLFYSFITSHEEKNSYVILSIMAAMTMGQILLSTGSYLDYFYRSPLYVPFLAAMILSSKQHLQSNFILYGLYTTCQNWLCICNDNNLTTFNLQVTNKYLAKDFNNFGCLILEKYIGEHMPVLLNKGLITAICFALAVVLFVVNKPDSKKLSITKLGNDKMVFILSLYMPLILTLFVGMCADYAFRIPYEKTIYFGSEYIEQPMGFTNVCYFNQNGMLTYEHKIVYESGTCLINGEDQSGRRIIHPEGISFGPYTTLYEGTYQVSVVGQNLESIGLNCTNTQDNTVHNIDIRDAYLSDSLAAYVIVIDERTSDIEFGVYNNTEEDVIVDNIIIQEIKP